MGDSYRQEMIDTELKEIRELLDDTYAGLSDVAPEWRLQARMGMIASRCARVMEFKMGTPVFVVLGKWASMALEAEAEFAAEVLGIATDPLANFEGPTQ
jgi:hypothetical protein